MITTGKFVYFNYTQYEEQDGRSYGFAKSPDHERQIFLGTFFHVFPMISENKVIMGRERNPEPLDVETPLEGRNVVIVTRELKKGLGGNWCFAEEWEMMEDRNKIEQERQRAAEEETRRIEAATEEALRQLRAEKEKKLTENPGTIEEALSRGWVMVEGGNGRQRILERSFPNETKSRRITRHLPSSSKLTKSRLVRAY